jgi:hypothetical protein
MATTITSVSPTSAPTTGGVLVDVYGTGFVSTGYAFNLNAGTNNQGMGGGQEVPQTFISTTHVQFTTPSANVQGYNPAGPATICYWLTNPGVIQATFAFTLTPSTISGGTALAASAGMTVAGSQMVGAAVSMAATAKLTPAISGPKFSTLTDDFAVAGTPNTAKWQVVNANPAVQNVGGQLTMPLAANTFGNLSVVSGIPGHIQFYDLTESYVSVQLVNAGLQDQYHSVTMYVEDATSTWQLQLNITNNVMYVASGGVTYYQGAYSSTSDQWIRFREHAGTTYFEVSADGVDWKVLSTFATIPSATYLYVSLQAASFTSTGAASTVVWDNFNLGPPVAVMAATTTLTSAYTGYGTAPLAASAGMTMAATVSEVATTPLAASASLTVAATRQVNASIAQTGVGALAVAASVQQAASFNAVVNGNLTVTALSGNLGSINFVPVSNLTVAVTVKEIATVSLAGHVSLTVTAQLSITSTVTQTGVAALNVAGTRVVTPTLSMASVTNLTVAAITVEQGGVTMAASTTFNLTTMGQTFAIAPLMAQTQLYVANAPTWLGQATLVGTGGMAVGSVVLTGSTFTGAATAGLTVTGFTRQVASVLMAATAGLTVTGIHDIEMAAAHLTGGSGLNIVAVLSTTSTVIMHGHAVLVALSTSRVSGTVVMSGASQLTVLGTRRRLGVVAFNGATDLGVTAALAQFASVHLVGAPQLSVAGVTTRWDSAHLTASAALGVVTTARVLASVRLVGNAHLMASGTRVVGSASVAFVASTTITVHGQTIKPGQVAMSATAGMAVVAAPLNIHGQVAMAAVTSMNVSGQTMMFYLVAHSSLTLAPSVHQQATVHLLGLSVLNLQGELLTQAAVAFAALTGMIVNARAHGNTPFDWPDLADQLNALVGVDPTLLGAQGTMDDVYTERLGGDVT